MLREFLIPTTYAQGLQNAAGAAAGAAEEGARTGIGSLVDFVVRNIDNWIAGAVIVVIFWILAKMAANAAREQIIRKKGDEIHEASLLLVERVTVVTILTIGAAIAFAINGLNFTAVIGALSLGIGFALKDIISNFISGVIMLSQNRIRIGDLVKVGEILGTIVSIDVRATVLQSIDGTEVVIPNQNMLNETLISYSTNPFRRIDLVVGVDYGTDLPMVTSLIKEIIDQDIDIVPEPEPLVLVDGFGDSAINIKILFWIESSKNWMKIRSNLANRIKHAFNEIGINIPFPIRTLKVDENDRALLKTLASAKEGFVPDPKQTPDNEKVVQAAANTKDMPQVPMELGYEKPKRQKAAQPETEPPKTEEAKEEKQDQDQKEPAAVAQAAAQAVEKVQQESEKSDSEKQTPPPTHL